MVEISLKSSDLIYLSVSLFEVVNPKGVIQIIPGFKEHKERYYDFVNYLNVNNFNVIISDVRGHGKSISGNYNKDKRFQISGQKKWAPCMKFN